MKRIIIFLTCMVLVFTCLFAPEVNYEKRTNLEEKNKMVSKTQIEYQSLVEDLANLPLTFVYDDVVYRGFSSLYFKEVSRKTKSERNGELTTITLEKDNLTISLEMAIYNDYDAYDYVVYFTNNSKQNSKVIKKVNAIDLYFEGANAHLKGILGDHTNKYAPYDYDLAEKDVNFESLSGRPCHGNFPYFNLETDNGGAMIALGWGGTWKADFSYDTTTSLTHVVGEGTVGLETYLKPGETIRTPLVGIVRYYEKDEAYATNAWRRWIVDCNLPREYYGAEESVQPMLLTNISNDTGLVNSDGSISENSQSWKRSLDAFYDNGLKADYRWFDAGWYFDPYGKTVPSDWWGTVGTWELDTVKWPDNSFAESVSYARKKGTKTLVWFEPERVTRLDGMVKNYGYNREWVLADNGNNNNFLNNLGNKECLEWTANRILAFMETYKIDMYREDFNMTPGPMWKIGDGYEGKNRSGITENLYIQGHYELWDRIIAYGAVNGRSVYVDSCASGGGRNDLETVRRSIMLLRSDSDRTTIDLRLAYTTTVNKWLPFAGTMAKEGASELSAGTIDVYSARGTMLPATTYSGLKYYHDKDTLNWAELRQTQSEWEEISKYLLKDFYTLTPYRGITNSSEWTVFMYVDPDTNSGVVQAFRQQTCDKKSIAVALKGLDPNCYYSVRDIDGKNSIERVKGSALMKTFLISADNPRTAITLYVEPVE